MSLELEDLNLYVTKEGTQVNSPWTPVAYPIKSVERDRQFGSEEFTIVILTYNRMEMLLKLLRHLSGLPKLNQVIVIWNNENPPDPKIRWPATYKMRVRII